MNILEIMQAVSSLFGNASTTVEEATARAQASVSDQDVRKTWILFGDPSQRLGR